MSGVVAFFGHRDVLVTAELEEKLEDTVRALIASGYNEFWCCEQGNFDWISRLVMLNLKEEYRHIQLCYICPYNPTKYSKMRQEFLEKHYDVIYPEEAYEGPPRFAITRRNKYIAENADVFVCYINHNSGGAFDAIQIARKLGKEIINLAEYDFS